MSGKFVYTFGDGKAEGNATMKLLLGGKGANLAEMSNLGVPVPAGFTISTPKSHILYLVLRIPYFVYLTEYPEPRTENLKFPTLA